MDQPVAVSRRIDAPAHDIFQVLANPGRHPEFDGSESLRGVGSTAVISGVGDIFVMKMYFPHIGDYEMNNHVVEYEPDRRIGWEPQAGRGHPARATGNLDPPRWGHRWSYQLTPDGADATIVTEIYDCSAAPEHERVQMDNGNIWAAAMAGTLERLDALCTHQRTEDHQMTGSAREGDRILGSLRSEDGKGAVRMEDRYDTGIDDLWSALTDPGRLARWIGEVSGDLRPGGEYRFYFFSSGAEGTGRVEACEPPRRLLLTQGLGKPDEQVIEATLTADGDQTILVLEQRGMPLNLLAAYGAGIQVHVEDLAAHIAGRERCDANARWAELQPAYETLAANVS
jgi:uncharacterized protein YndB with AHSA1/START domain